MVSINTNTGISIGIVIVLLGGFAVVIKGINDSKTETTAMKTELSMQALTTKTELQTDIKELKGRITNIELGKNSWTSTDMFKWAVHLQQSNPQIKVPEPEVPSK